MSEIYITVQTKEGQFELIEEEWCNFDNSKLHCSDNPACKYKNGRKEWWINGKPHREDGPAIENVNGSKGWWVDGKLHRLDGPAMIFKDGYEEWWIDGERLPAKLVEQWIKENNIDLSTKEGQMAFKLRWS